MKMTCKSGTKTPGSGTLAVFTMAEEDLGVTPDRDMKMNSCYYCSMVFPNISSHWQRPEVFEQLRMNFTLRSALVGHHGCENKKGLSRRILLNSRQYREGT